MSTNSSELCTRSSVSCLHYHSTHCTAQQLIKMQTISLLVCLSLLLAASWAAPPATDFTEPFSSGVRLQRATCDLLSVTIMGNSVGDSACAAHCLALRRGFKGGHCRDGVCHCRR